MSSKIIFLLGMGGAGMEPLGRYLCARGYTVYGWDDVVSSDRREALQASGLIFTENIPTNCEIFVYSSAISTDHPIFKAAIQRDLPVVCRGKFLADLLRNEKIVAITGSHGKSSTTALLIHCFKRAGIPLNYLLGAAYQGDIYPTAEYSSNAFWTVLEVDESDGTIDSFQPAVTLILNDDWDHPAHYPSKTAYQQTLQALCQRTHEWVLLSEEIHWNIEGKARIYHLDKDFSYENSEISLVLQCLTKANLKETYRKGPHFGVENMSMALAAFALLNNRMAPVRVLKTFPGIKRRQEVLLNTSNLCILSDYAHHPTELETFLDYVQKTFLGKHWVAFEPHRMSRLQCFFKDFVHILQKQPHLFLERVYRAFETKSSPYKDILKVALPDAKNLNELRPEDFLKASNMLNVISFIGAGTIDISARAWVGQLIGLWKAFLEKNSQEKLEVYYPLTQKSTFHLKGETLFFAQPKTVQGLQNLLKTAHVLGIDPYILGSGSNVLVPSKRYDGLVIQLSEALWTSIEPSDPLHYQIGAGCKLSKLLQTMQQAGVGGFEFLDGIPGTLGGALRMNAGTGQQGIWSCVDQVEVLEPTGELRWLDKKEVIFTYRDCPTLADKIVLRALVSGYKSSTEQIQSQRQALRQRRQGSQPKGASLGCFFKNLNNVSTGKLLDKLGLKGTRVGGAYVSQVHANFILNDGTATFEDVIELVARIQSEVEKKTIYKLEPEVKILGNKWEKFL